MYAIMALRYLPSSPDNTLCNGLEALDHIEVPAADPRLVAEKLGQAVSAWVDFFQTTEAAVRYPSYRSNTLSMDGSSLLPGEKVFHGITPTYPINANGHTELSAYVSPRDDITYHVRLEQDPVAHTITDMTVRRMDPTQLEYQGEAVTVIVAGEPALSYATEALGQAQMAYDHLRTVQA